MVIAPSELILNPDGSVYHLGLVPSQIADLVITVGDPDRVESVAKHLSNREFTSRRREFVATTGYFNSTRLTVLSTGMGTDNVEIVMNELDALVNIDLKTRTIKPDLRPLSIIRIGTSGALQKEIPIDSLLASHAAIGLDSLMSFYQLQSDPTTTRLETEVQQQLGLPFRPYIAYATKELVSQFAFDMVHGLTLTCPGFYGPQGRVLRLPTAIPDAVDAYTRVRLNAPGLPKYITNFEMETAGYYAMAALLGHKVLSLNAIVAQRAGNTFSTNPSQTVDTLIEKVLSRI